MKKKYHISISFSGTERKYANVIHSILSANKINCFYDEANKKDLWGKNLVEELSEIYENQCKYCLILISKEYCERAYTNLERRSALDRMVLNKETEYILPIKFDNSWIKGLSKSTSYLDIRTSSIIEICEMIYQKIKKTKVPKYGLFIPDFEQLDNLEYGNPKLQERDKYNTQNTLQLIYQKIMNHKLNNEGEDVIKYYHNNTINLYDHIADLIKYGNKEKIESHILAVQFIVLRYRISKKGLITENLSGIELIRNAINSGFTGKADISNKMTIKRFEIISDKIIDVGPTEKKSKLGGDLRFELIDNKWLLDMTPAFKALNLFLTLQAETLEISKIALLDTFIKTTCLRGINGEDWLPLFAKN